MVLFPDRDGMRIATQARDSMRKCCLLYSVLVGSLIALGQPARAGQWWDSDDFIITGGPNFPDRIGIFDHDLTFKGYLETNFLTVGGIDFDAAGNLVATSNQFGDIRVYSPAGDRIGGFMYTPVAGTTGIGLLKVAPNGNYLLGSRRGGSGGVREYRPDGTFIPLALSRQELADMIGTTIETSIRIMSRWSKEDVVRTEKDGFTVVDRPALEAVAIS